MVLVVFDQGELDECRVVENTLRLVAIEGDRARVLDSATLESGQFVVRSAQSQTKLSLLTGHRYPHAYEPAVDDLVAVDGIADAELVASSLDAPLWFSPPALNATDEYCALLSVSSYDCEQKVGIISTPSSSVPTLIREEVVSECGCTPVHVELSGDYAILSLGERGLRLWTLAGN